jgi:2-methylisocitrate lyase-like PEP mutase family enzyme
MPERQRMTTRLKTLFQRPALFVLAGGINPIGAKMAEALGFDAFYMSGGNTSAHQLGWPDSGTSMRDMVDNARKIVLTVQIPVFADADTGYGDAISTHYTVREYIQAGIAGAHIEDQTFPPKSGPRRRCISIQEMVGKLRAAMSAACRAPALRRLLNAARPTKPKRRSMSSAPTACAPGKKFKRRSASFPGPSFPSFPPTCRRIPPYRRSRMPGPPRPGSPR